MGNISVSLPSDGTTADVADYNTPITTIVNAINGNLDNSNLVSGAAIATDRIADSAITTAKIADANVTNAKLAANVAWTTWTPTLTNMSGGTLTYSKYQQIGKVVFFKFKYVLAGAGVSGEITLTTPTTMSAEYLAEDYLNGQANFYDLSVLTSYTGNIRVNSTTAVTLRCIHTDGARATNQAASSTNPFSFATGDIITAHGYYEAA